MNGKSVEKYAQRKRLYVFIIATQDFSASHFDLSKIFEDSSSNLEDLQALRNAIKLISQLKQERVHREVYLLKDSFRDFERKYRFLMASKIYKTRFVQPT
jgi:hypothetical protein